MAYLAKFDPTLNDWRNNTNTMNTKHTPGPWHVGRYTPNATEMTILTKNGSPVTPAWGPQFYVNSEQAKANACLIAAAPDLLAALDALIAAIYEGKYVDPYSDVYRDALNAIAKATGPTNL